MAPELFADVVSLEGVGSSLAAARDGIDAVLRDRGLRRTTPEHTAAALLQGAAASATLEGDPIAADDLAAGGGGPTARAALRLSTELLGLTSVLRRAPLQAVARIHALAASGSVPDADLGRPGNPSGRDRLARLARDLASADQAPALAVAAVAHAEIATAEAFGSHDGVVARAVERLILVERGIDPASVLVSEAAHAEAARAYAGALEAYGSGDPHSWMLYVADVYTRAAELSPVTAS